jgi:hypothetical protein
MQRLGDRARLQVLRHGQVAAQQRQLVALRVGALRHRELAEILARGASGAHIRIGDQGEARVRTPRAVGINRIARETAEIRQQIAEAGFVRGVTGDAGDYLGVAVLHGARGAAQRDHAARAAHRQVFQKARRDPDLLGEADRRVGGEREAGDADSVDVGFHDAGRADQTAQRLREEPCSTILRATQIRLRHRAAKRDTAVAPRGHRRFSPRVSMQPPLPKRRCAIAFSSPRAIFWLAVSGSASTKAIQPGTLK